MKIRKAKKEDIPAVVELGHELLKHHHRYREYYEPVSNSKEREKAQRKYYEKMLKARNSLFLVAEDVGEVVGYSITKIEKNPPVLKEKLYGNFGEIYIDYDYRGKELGTMLVEESMRWLKKKKINRVIVDYDAKNKWAENLYRKAGFTPFQNKYEVYLK